MQTLEVGRCLPSGRGVNRASTYNDKHGPPGFHSASYHLIHRAMGGRGGGGEGEVAWLRTNKQVVRGRVVVSMMVGPYNFGFPPSISPFVSFYP